MKTSRETVAFFLPTRKGSERVKNKNTKPFAGIEGGLVENKVRQLLQTKNIDEILLSTNDEDCMETARRCAAGDSRLRIVRRPNELCLGTTNLQDLISYVPTITEAEHIVWGHVTTPLCGAAQYDAGVERYFEGRSLGYDSLVGVCELKNFLMDGEGHLVNNDTPLPWPRTQDLKPLYEVNHTMFIAGRSIYKEQRNRLGSRPMLYVMDKILSMDIDWPEDFVMAEAMFMQQQGK